MSENYFDLESHDVSGVGRAPTVRYVLAADGLSFSAEVPGGLIHISATAEGGRRSRIVLKNTITGEVFADVESTQCEVPSVGEQWANSALYAGEIGASLYWSMWRKQQIDAAIALESAK